VHSPSELPHRDLREQVARAASATESGTDFPRAYIEHVRTEAAKLATPDDEIDDIRAAVALIEQYASVSANAPTDSVRRSAAAAKQVVQRAVFFATHHLATQMSSLGYAVVWLGNATADRIEALEQRLGETDDRLRRELAELRDRIDRLEHDS
jgi:HAMP domain-containing protein